MMIDPALRDALLLVPVPTLSQTLYARGLRSRFLHGIVPLNPGCRRFCGAAFTIRAIPVREDLRDAAARGEAPNLHRACFDAAPPGSVLVCATGGAARVSVLGDIIATALAVRGLAGAIVDTGVADAPAVARLAFPVLAAGGSAPVPSAAEVMVVDHSLPIGIVGVAVFPGDIIVGDENGAVCLPPGIAAEVAAVAGEKAIMEDWLVAQIEAGAPLEGTYPPDAATLARYRASRG